MYLAYASHNPTAVSFHDLEVMPPSGLASFGESPIFHLEVKEGWGPEVQGWQLLQFHSTEEKQSIYCTESLHLPKSQNIKWKMYREGCLIAENKREDFSFICFCFDMEIKRGYRESPTVPMSDISVIFFAPTGNRV